MSEQEKKELLEAGAAMAEVCDRLIMEFNRNPLQPNIAMLVTRADRALAEWNRVNQPVP